MLDTELSEPYPPHTQQNKKTNSKCQRKKWTGWLHGKGGTKWHLAFVSWKRNTFMQHLSQNRWEPVELLVSVPSSQQMKLVDQAGGFWCLFSCWCMFAQGFGLAGVASTASLSDYLISNQNQAETAQEKTKKYRPAEGLLLLSRGKVEWGGWETDTSC